MNKSGSGMKFKTIFNSLILIIFIVAGVLFTKINDQPTLWDKLVNRFRQEFGMSLEELNATPEMKKLRESGLPEEAIYPYIQGPQKSSDLYPVTDNSTVTVFVASGDYEKWSVKNASFSDYSGAQIDDVVQKVEPMEGGSVGIAYAMVYFGSFPPGAYHQTYTMHEITLNGTQTTIKQQLNWQPFFLTRRDVNFLVVSQEEMDLLNKVRKMCKAKWCDFSQDL
jgi:hypothetical protein